ncbi:unnamed protein product [Dibothriocephalus latus]|uniref:Uncharacterized protein n=1 Tax=Dibothriocephalus latus TaxID=60516 RepID=A0A3P7NP90_DIBLA|nr:unnamed protein product [Dibothriocephalus latus]
MFSIDALLSSNKDVRFDVPSSPDSYANCEDNCAAPVPVTEAENCPSQCLQLASVQREQQKQSGSSETDTWTHRFPFVTAFFGDGTLGSPNNKTISTLLASLYTDIRAVNQMPKSSFVQNQMPINLKSSYFNAGKEKTGL